MRRALLPLCLALAACSPLATPGAVVSRQAAAQANATPTFDAIAGSISTQAVATAWGHQTAESATKTQQAALSLYSATNLAHIAKMQTFTETQSAGTAQAVAIAAQSTREYAPIAATMAVSMTRASISATRQAYYDAENKRTAEAQSAADFRALFFYGLLISFALVGVGGLMVASAISRKIAATAVEAEARAIGIKAKAQLDYEMSRLHREQRLQLAAPGARQSEVETLENKTGARTFPPRISKALDMLYAGGATNGAKDAKQLPTANSLPPEWAGGNWQRVVNSLALAGKIEKVDGVWYVVNGGTIGQLYEALESGAIEL